MSGQEARGEREGQTPLLVPFVSIDSNIKVRLERT